MGQSIGSCCEDSTSSGKELNSSVGATPCSEEYEGVGSKLLTTRLSDDCDGQKHFHPIVSICKDFKDCFHLVRLDDALGLPVPWPRCQDIKRRGSKENAYLPRSRDLTFALSHGWSYETHPDPLGEKHTELKKFLQAMMEKSSCDGDVYGFVDFLSVAQRPWLDGQAPRTLEEDILFHRAVRVIPLVYLASDIVIHLDLAWRQVQGDEEEYEVDSDELVGLLGNKSDLVSVTSSSPKGLAKTHDYVVAVGGKKVDGPLSAEELSAKCREAQQSGCPFKIRLARAPFGFSNKVPSSLRGWVYLERFYTMVKLAFLDESAFDFVCYSNSKEVLEQIREGARVLRKAARDGEEALRRVMDYFEGELASKLFKPASTDWRQRAQDESDHDLVKGMMRAGVKDLVRVWGQEQQRQLQRQMMLAIWRTDTAAVENLLRAGVDPNHTSEHDSTFLHVAARCRSLEIVRLLLGYGGDLSKQDTSANLPAHVVPLFRDDITVALIKELATSEALLSSQNLAGISAFDRFMTYVTTELHAQPLLSANAYIEDIGLKYPHLLVDREMKSCGFTSDTHASDPVLDHEELEVEVDGIRVKFDIFAPVGRKVKRHILCFCSSFFVPWEISLQSMSVIASEILDKLQAKMIVLSQKSIAPILRDVYSFRGLHIRVGNLVAALPLPRSYILVDMSLGALTPMLWTLRPNLEGAMIVNLRGFFGEDYSQSEVKTKMSKRFATIASAFEQADIDELSSIFGDYVCANNSTELLRSIEKFKESVSLADESYFKYGKLYCTLVAKDILETTRMYIDAPIWTTGIPVLLIAGASSPSMWTQEAVVRLQMLLDGKGECSVENIPKSKSCWELEGNEQAITVARLLADFVESFAFAI